MLFQCRRIWRIFIYGRVRDKNMRSGIDWRVVTLLFLFSSTDEEISRSSNCFSLLDSSNKLEFFLYFPAIPTLCGQKYDDSIVHHFIFVTSIQIITCAMRKKTCLTGSLQYKYRVIFVLVHGVICTLRSVVG